MIGTTIAHYRVSAKLGAGGMGEVFRATDTKLGRDVALKVLPSDAAQDSTARAQLIEEARSASALNHPHICHIYEVNEADGVTFFAMELAEGEPLSKRIPSGGLPAETVIRYCEQIASALAHAHERGILHRDLKSANVMITRDGAAKVLDFGLAQRLGGDRLAEATRSKITVQEERGLAGTLSYLAPEILRGEPATERSDIWALGVLLYEAAAGVLPFEGRTGYELTSAILRETPRPLENIAPALRTVVQRCLAKEPTQRYQKASEVRAALEAIRSSGYVVAPSGRAARPRWLWPALGVAAFLMIVLAVAQPWKRAAQPPITPTAATSTGSVPGAAFLIARPSSNPEANELLQRAMMFTRFQLDPLRARPMLQKALELDPKFSEARVNYALTYIVGIEIGVSNDPGDMYRAEEELRRVLKEDPEMSRAHALMSAVHFYQGRGDLANEEGRKAIQLAPNDLGGRMWLMIFGRFDGNTAESIRIGRSIIETEPLFWPPRYHIGEAYREQGDAADAVREQLTVLEQDPENVAALRCLTRAYLDAGDLKKAQETIARVRPEAHRNFRVRILRAQLYAVEGKHAQALKEMDEQVLKYADMQPFGPLDAAEVYAVVGQKEKAIEWLERSMRKGDGRSEWLKRDPLLENIRQHPRFQQILESMEYRRQQRVTAPAKP